jgi:hypothetical protein
VLTFDEFLAIPPCTTGTHSDVDDTPAPAPKPAPEVADSIPAAPRLPAAQAAPQAAAAPAPPPESEDDDPEIELKKGASCRRKGCGVTHSGGGHPGAPIFHEGSKGWSCCKRRVLEFDQFMNIEGCKTKDRHLFVGSGQKDKAGAEEKLETVRFVQHIRPARVAS